MITFTGRQCHLCCLQCILKHVSHDIKLRVCIHVRMRQRERREQSAYSNEPQRFQGDFMIRKLI